MFSFLNKLFKNKKIKSEDIDFEKKPEPIIQNKIAPIIDDCIYPSEIKKIFQLKEHVAHLTSKDHFVAKSEYLHILPQYKETIDFFCVLISSQMIGSYCSQYRINEQDIIQTVSLYNSFAETIDRLNDEYLSEQLMKEKEYLDTILAEVDPVIMLDDDQRKVVLSDEDYSLVIAGAGAGKTTTVAAKVKYLVEKRRIKPSEILVVSFTNKAVNELKEKINTALKIECPIATFHSTGNAVIHVNSPDEKLNIVDESKLYFVIRDYLKNSILQNETMVDKLILFFASYFDAPYEGTDLNAFFNNIAKANYSTMRSDLEDFKQEVINARTKRSETIRGEFLRSRQEVEIANYLYLNNINYEYEPIYPYNVLQSRKPYTPDFKIVQDDKVAYLEHFGISENGENDRYSTDELNRYKKAINDKVRIHKQHDTTFLYTFSSYNDRRPLVDHLRQELEAKGFELCPRSNNELLEMLVAGEENRYIRKLINLLSRFIANFKVCGYGMNDFDRMHHSTQNVRSRLFLDICQDCYMEYERWLKQNCAVDFQDMINESARILREVKEMKKKLHFKYIIVDEYQDISRQRFDLTKALSDVCDAKIIAVGDDWQSIYAFSGSDITLFTKFAEKMGYARMLKIVKTYRNSQEVIDIAGSFIQKNASQISKKLISPKNIEEPVIIYTYDTTYKQADADRRSGVNYALSRSVEIALEQLLEFKQKEGKKAGSILVLGRYGFDGDSLERSGLFEFVNRGSKIKSVKYPTLDITFMTVHSSKGLGYDDVIVINGKNETYGFPSKVEDDPVLSFVIKGDQSIDYAEERRLFYVAMTRTKNRVFFIAPKQNPSEFLLELKRDYKNVELFGEWNEVVSASTKKPCPICGYPLQLKYKKAYGLRLYICTNEPEVCGFMTNDLRAQKMAIQKCDKCQDGYMIVKPGKDHFFLGCTNYKNNGTGCNNTMSMKAYYDLMHYEEEPLLLQLDESKAKTIPQTTSEKAAVQLSKSVIDESLKDDHVEIVRANIEPVVYEKSDLNDTIYIILKALQNISKRKFYNMSTLINVLRGVGNDVVKNNGLDLCDEYGVLSSISYDIVRSIIEWMVHQNLIRKTKGRYPVLHSTYEGLHYAEHITVKTLKKLKKYLEEDVILWEK